MKSTRRQFQIDRKSISFIKFILEAYDGIAYMTTIDSETAKIELYIAPGSEVEANQLINDLKQVILIRGIDE